ncbi:MAG TPA: DUF5719 family protein [Actinomycetota bacterium]|nr:DUF5719 family protein [Actinomycetota bacterium]
MRRTEIAFIAVLLAIIAAAPVVDARLERRGAEPAPSTGRVISAGWYCPTPPGDSIDNIISTANVSDSTMRLRRSAIGGGDATAIIESDLPRSRRSSIPMRDLGLADGVGVSEAFGAASTTDMVALDRSGGVSSSRCAAQPWDRWMFAVGSTSRAHNTFLLVANPFREEAVIRVRIITHDQDVVPARLKDFVVPEFSQSVIFLEEFFTETALFGMEVTATRGRVVASRYMRMAAKDGIRGSSLDIGVRSPFTQWYFAGGEVPADGEETLVLMNPSSQEALVQVTFPGEKNQESSPQIQEIALPAGRQVAVKVSDHVPRGTRHSTAVSSTNGVPIIAERQTIAPHPSGSKAMEIVVPVSTAARKWAVPVGTTAGGTEILSIFNSSGDPGLVKITLISDRGESKPAELANLRAEPGRRLTIDMNPFAGAGPAVAVVEAISGEIVVERQVSLGGPYNDFAESPGQPID